MIPLIGYVGRDRDGSDDFPFNVYNRGDYLIEIVENQMRADRPASLGSFTFAAQRTYYLETNLGQTFPYNSASSGGGHMQRDVDDGRMVIFSSKTNGPSWAQVGSGSSDSQITTMGNQVKTFCDNNPDAILIWTWHHEPNSNGTPTDWVAAWRRVVDIWVNTCNVPEWVGTQTGTTISGGVIFAGPNMACSTYGVSGGAATDAEMRTWYQPTGTSANWTFFWQHCQMYCLDGYNAGNIDAQGLASGKFRTFAENIAGISTPEHEQANNVNKPRQMAFGNELTATANALNRVLLHGVFETSTMNYPEPWRHPGSVWEPTIGTGHYQQPSNYWNSLAIGAPTARKWWVEMAEWLAVGNWQHLFIVCLYDADGPRDEGSPWMLDTSQDKWDGVLDFAEILTGAAAETYPNVVASLASSTDSTPGTYSSSLGVVGANKLLIAFVNGESGTPTPTPTVQNVPWGVSWQLDPRGTNDWGGSGPTFRKGYVFVAKTTAGGASDTFDVNFGSAMLGCEIIVYEIDEADLTFNAIDAVRQLTIGGGSGTTHAPATLSAPSSPENFCQALYAQNIEQARTVGAGGWVETFTASHGAPSLSVALHSNPTVFDTTPSTTVPATARFGAWGLEIVKLSTNRAGRVTWSEMQVPTAPRRGRLTMAEMEVPTANRSGRIMMAEMEVPGGAIRGILSWAEMEIPPGTTPFNLSIGIVTTINTEVDASTFSSGLSSPRGNRLIIALVDAQRTGSLDPVTPTVINSPWGLTFVRDPRGDNNWGGTGATRRKGWVFLAQTPGTRPGYDTFDIDFGGVTHAGCEVIVLEIAGSDLTVTPLQQLVQLVNNSGHSALYDTHLAGPSS